MLWSETRRVPIVSVLRATEVALAEQDESAGRNAALAEVRRQIAGRERDPRFAIEVRHVGSLDDPFAVRALDARGARADHAAALRARKALQASGEEPTPEAVAAERGRDPEWGRELAVMCREWILAGVVGEEAEYHRLYELGGGDLLLHAMREVQAAQSVTPELSESSALGFGVDQARTTATPANGLDSSRPTATAEDSRPLC